MKLRDKLQMHKGTFYNWPPIWTNCQDPIDKPQGEIGNLEDVFMSECDYDVLFIAIEYQARRYIGALEFDSPDLCFQIYSVLQSRIGLSIDR